MTEKAMREFSPPPTVTSRAGKRAAKRVVFLVLVYAALAAGAVFFVMPFFWMLSTSFKGYGEIFAIPITWIPKVWVFSNYAEVFAVSEDINVMRGFLNTLAVVVPTTLVGCLTAALAAFAFAKIKFPGRDKIFLAFVGTMAIPGIISMIPSYIIYSRIHWVNTWLPLMIPGMLGGAGAVFFTRQFMRGIPASLEEAARIDGMSWWGVFWKIELPLSKSVVITNFLFGFLAGYNDYLGPTLYLSGAPRLKTLQQMLSLLNDTMGTKWGVQMAGSCLAIIPTLLLFVFAQRYFIEGIVLSGVKD
jgi:multiple sugar transport system permease protein